MKTMLKSKKIISVFMTVVMLAVMSCTGVFATDSGEYSEADDVQEMTYLGEIDGMPTWKAEIPVRLNPYNGSEVFTKSPNPIVTVYQKGDILYCSVDYRGAALTHLTASCKTYGQPAGSSSKSDAKSNPNHEASIIITFGFYERPIIKSGTQYFDVGGTATSKYAPYYFPFGPTTYSIHITGWDRVNKK